MATFTDDEYSDLFKEVHGFRPRGDLWKQWMAMSPEQKQQAWDRLVSMVEPDDDDYGDDGESM